MRKFTERFVVFLVDFDQHEDRMQHVRTGIPEDLIDRVFVLGAWSEPEALKGAGLGSYETIGKAMADDCQGGTDTIWGHELLQHNVHELNRLREDVVPILFSFL